MEGAWGRKEGVMEWGKSCRGSMGEEGGCDGVAWELWGEHGEGRRA